MIPIVNQDSVHMIIKDDPGLVQIPYPLDSAWNICKNGEDIHNVCRQDALGFESWR